MTGSCLSRIAGAILETSARNRDVAAVGPFQAFFAPTSNARPFNYAVPVELPADRSWRGSVVELKEAFRQRDRQPRLEYLDELWPSLGHALLRAGFAVEMRAPVMVLADGARAARPRPIADVRILGADDPDELFLQFLHVSTESFDLEEHLDTPEELTKLRHEVSVGWTVPALAFVGGVPAACGALLLSGGLFEIAGVGTVPGMRRRGLAHLLCQTLVDRAIEVGDDMVWLASHDGAALSLYRRLGFRPVGHQICFRDGRP